jgi:hypothetical protein
MRVCSLFPAPHLYPRDNEQVHARRAGIVGLRHKSRHKFFRSSRSGLFSANCPGVLRPTHLMYMNLVACRKKFENPANEGSNGQTVRGCEPHLT